LAGAALGRGVLIEPGDVFFADERPPSRFVRLGFAAIPSQRIEDGIRALAAVHATLRPAANTLR
ncbi:MAG: PLP-dependent aminotransferase family protein, partial [Aromatoleum sp.]|nr:PLP-dependent aminotransferase family protein [Aromatoleum sp.]